MGRIQISFSEFAMSFKVENTVIENGTECWFVPPTDDLIFRRLRKFKPRNDLQDRFLTAIRVATTYEDKGFFVPVYYAGENCKHRLVTDPNVAPVFNRTVSQWSGYAKKYGYSIGCYNQFIRWLGYMAWQMMGNDERPFDDVVNGIFRPALKTAQEVHTCRVMYDGGGTDYARVTGMSEKDRMRSGRNILNQMIGRVEVTGVSASPFLIIPQSEEEIR